MNICVVGWIEQRFGRPEGCGAVRRLMWHWLSVLCHYSTAAYTVPIANRTFFQLLQNLKKNIGCWYKHTVNFDVLLTAHPSITLANDELDAQLIYFVIRLLQSSTCFEQRRAHH